MKQLEKCLKSRQGTTLVEMLVTLTLITVMVGMAATTLSAAFKKFSCGCKKSSMPSPYWIQR